MKKRRVMYVSGTRADFGLMRHTLQHAAADPRLDVCIAVTGMHLDTRYGHTVDEILGTNIPISVRVPNDLTHSNGLTMARALAKSLEGFAQALSDQPPDLVLVLGDRGEMLAAALAAVHLNIPLAHIHGGERSGTIDESIRHAISKLAHYHFVTTEGARERLIRMGELPAHVFVTGAPGVDGLSEFTPIPRETLFAQAKLDSAKPVCLMLFHPVVQQEQQAYRQTCDILSATLASGFQVLCLLPNADSGSDAIRAAIEKYRDKLGVSIQVHLPRDVYLSWMSQADLMLGNSSSGLIEAASFGRIVVNIGDRQRCRERGENVIDVHADYESIMVGISKARTLQGTTFTNIYGDGHAAQRITELLATLKLEPALLEKLNTY